MWFCNKDNIALNLTKATTINIKKANNKFRVYATYTDTVQERYLLDTFNTLKEAQIFIRDILINLNNNISITNHENNSNSNTETGTGLESESGSNSNTGTNTVQYAFIEFNE